MPYVLPSSRVLAAVAALAVAGGALGVAAYRAVHVDPLPPAAPMTLDGGARAEGAARAPVLHAAAGGAADDIDNDPFDPERQLPAPPEDESAAAVDEMLPPPVAPAAVRILGVVVLPGGGGFAVYQLPSEVPKTVRIGETIGRLTLVAVEPGRAIFRAADGVRVELNLTTGT